MRNVFLSLDLWTSSYPLTPSEHWSKPEPVCVDLDTFLECMCYSSAWHGSGSSPTFPGIVYTVRVLLLRFRFFSECDAQEAWKPWWEECNCLNNGKKFHSSLKALFHISFLRESKGILKKYILNSRRSLKLGDIIKLFIPLEILWTSLTATKVSTKYWDPAMGKINNRLFYIYDLENVTVGGSR